MKKLFERGKLYFQKREEEAARKREEKANGVISKKALKEIKVENNKQLISNSISDGQNKLISQLDKTCQKSSISQSAEVVIQQLATTTSSKSSAGSKDAKPLASKLLNNSKIQQLFLQLLNAQQLDPESSSKLGHSIFFRNQDTFKSFSEYLRTLKHEPDFQSAEFKDILKAQSDSLGEQNTSLVENNPLIMIGVVNMDTRKKRNNVEYFYPTDLSGLSENQKEELLIVLPQICMPETMHKQEDDDDYVYFNYFLQENSEDIPQKATQQQPPQQNGDKDKGKQSPGLVSERNKENTNPRNGDCILTSKENNQNKTNYGNGINPIKGCFIQEQNLIDSQEQVQAKDRSQYETIEEIPKQHNKGTLLFGVSYFTKNQVNEETNEKSNAIPDGHTQKALFVLSTVPLQGYIMGRLEQIALSFNNQDYSLLASAFENMNYNFKQHANIQESEVFLGSSLRTLVHFFKEKLLVIFKAVLLQKRILVYSKHTCATSNFIISLLSLIPGLPLFNLRSKSINALQIGLNEYGLPLRLFNEEDCPLQPFLITDDLTELQKFKGYLIGTSSQLVKSHGKIKADLIIDLDGSRIVLQNGSIKNALSLNATEKRFAQGIARMVENSLTDSDKSWKKVEYLQDAQSKSFLASNDWIRHQFAIYIFTLLSEIQLASDLASELALTKQSNQQQQQEQGSLVSSSKKKEDITIISLDNSFTLTEESDTSIDENYQSLSWIEDQEHHQQEEIIPALNEEKQMNNNEKATIQEEEISKNVFEIDGLAASATENCYNLEIIDQINLEEKHNDIQKENHNQKQEEIKNEKQGESHVSAQGSEKLKTSKDLMQETHVKVEFTSNGMDQLKNQTKLEQLDGQLQQQPQPCRQSSLKGHESLEERNTRNYSLTKEELNCQKALIRSVFKKLSEYNLKFLKEFFSTEAFRYWQYHHDPSISLRSSNNPESFSRASLFLENGFIYCGSIESGKRNGKGATFDHDNGRIERCEMYSDDVKNGSGTIETVKEDYFFEGQFKDDMKEGFGNLISEKLKYSGYFVKNRFHGSGSLIDGQKNHYEGEFVNNVKEGMGKYRSGDGSVYYVGNFQEDYFQGKGQLIKSDGIFYCGDFKKGEMHGQGEYHGKEFTYSGEFSRGKFAGQGIYKNLQTNDIFQGEFIDGELDSTQPCIIKYKNGDVYSGLIKNWLPEGEGLISYKDGSLAQGLFKQGQLVKQAEEENEKNNQ